MPKVLLIIPAFNEELNIVRVIENLKVALPQCDYIVINDCSSDKTRKLCRAHQYPHLDLPINVGLAGAVQAGYRYAHEYHYDIAIQYDADGQHRVEFIPLLVQAIEEGADIAIGSRFVTEKKPWTLRMLGSRLISISIKHVSGVWINDPTSGMRALSKPLITEYAYQMNYPPEPDTLAFQLRKGRSIQEVQVQMDERLEGESYLNLANSVRYMSRMLISILAIQRFRK